MFRLRAAFLIVTALPLGARAQGTERFSLRGNDVAIYNVAGRVTIERGDGNAVVVEVTRGGGDARQLKVEQRTVDGREALCVVYPRERIIYRQPGQRGNSNSSTTDNDCRTTGGGAGWFSRNRIEVASSGRGIEAWADIRITVPAGRDVRVKHMVGKVDVAGVDATLRLDVSSGSVSSRDTRGMLLVDAGSGGTTVSGHRGDLTVDVGSGGVSVADVSGRIVKVSTGSGGIHGSNVEAEDLSVDTGSGSIELMGVASQRVRVETGSGGAQVGLTSNARDVHIETGSGSVTLGMPSSFGARVDVSTGSGGIRSDFPVQMSGFKPQRNELHGTIGNGAGKVTIETGSGGVQLRRGPTGRGPV